jgi:hypothetical protein
MTQGQTDAARTRPAEAVVADTPTDYRVVVENAVAALASNTPDTRREAYERIRRIVARHLEQSGLSGPAAEIERLALDLAVRKTEQRWRAASPSAPAPEAKAAPKERTRTFKPRVILAIALLAAAAVAVAVVVVSTGLWRPGRSSDPPPAMAAGGGFPAANPEVRVPTVSADPVPTTQPPEPDEAPDLRPTNIAPLRADFDGTR